VRAIASRRRHPLGVARQGRVPALTWILGQQLWNGLMTGVAYSVFATGLTLIFGMMRIINFAHGEIYMLGAMILYTLTVSGVHFLLALLISVIAVGVFGLFFDRIAIRPLLKAHPLTILVSTMAVSVILTNGAAIIWNVDTRVIETPFGDGSVEVAGALLSNTGMVLSAIGLGVLGLFYLFATKSRLGRIMRATAQDRVGASLIGIDVKRMYSLTVAISAGLAAVAGGIIGPIWVASPTMGEDILLKGFAIVIVGGMGNVLGCVIAGIALGVTEALFGQYVSMYYIDVYSFGILILVCLLRPQGLFAGR